MTDGADRYDSYTQYGVRTPHSSTVLMVTTDLAAAQDALTWIQDGCIMARTLTVTAWQPADDHQGGTARGELERTVTPLPHAVSNALHGNGGKAHPATEAS